MDQAERQIESDTPTQTYKQSDAHGWADECKHISSVLWIEGHNHIRAPL